MDELCCAAVGNPQLAYNALAAALEASARAAGMAREASGGSTEVKVEVVEYEGHGAWLLLCVGPGPAQQLPRSLAVGLARTLRRGVTLHQVTARQGDPLCPTSFAVDAAGKLEALPPPPPVADGGAGDALSRSMGALRALCAGDEAAVLHRQRRTYHHRPTTGNPRLDRFLEAVEKAERVEILPEGDGRHCVRLLLPGGVRQSSYFSGSELEQLRAVAKL